MNDKYLLSMMRRMHVFLINLFITVALGQTSTWPEDGLGGVLLPTATPQGVWSPRHEHRGFHAKTFGLAFGLAHIPLFAGIAVAVVIGCYCCHKRKKSSADLTTIAEKGGLFILDDKLLQAKEEGRLTVNVSILENGKSSEPNDYSKSKDGVQVSPIKESHIKDQALPPVPKEENPNISPTKEGDPNKESIDTPVDTSFDGYTLLSIEHTEDEPPIDVVNDHDSIIGSHYETSDDLLGDEKTGDENDYEEPYWEPANKEEELMAQLAMLNVPTIAAKDIEIKDHLGRGQFGTVHSGVWDMSAGSDSDYEVGEVLEVAVKSMKSGASEEERMKFLQEAAIMGQFKNSYILQILGYMTGDPLKIVVEIMGKGDLQQHLISLRPTNNEHVCTELPAVLLSYSRQIALGMGYLVMKQYIHRDLAARNVLVSDEYVCKIADFGLSRDLQKGDYYVSQGGKIPVKWTAPEALHYRKYSTASDVWSYGCLLYEIWSLGHKPFHDITNVQAIQKVASGYRLPPPPGCPRIIYQIMIRCWHPKPQSRPNFNDVVVALQHPDFQVLKWTQKDIDSCNNVGARVLGSPLEDGHSLYTDLQHTYKKSTSKVGDEITQKQNTSVTCSSNEQDQTPHESQ